MTRQFTALIIALSCAFNASFALAEVAKKSQVSHNTPLPRLDNSRFAPSKGNVFSLAVKVAQKRCVKIYGAGIGREKGYATGLIVSAHGHILTATGIYLAGANIRVVTPDGDTHYAKVLNRSDAIQVAMLKIDTDTPYYFDVPKEQPVQQGDWVVAVANPFKVADIEEQLSINLGVVTMRASLDTKRRAQDFDVEGDILLVDAITSNPGSPGGALMTLDGKLAGMIGKILESQTTNTRLNYAIPSDLLRRFIDGKPITDTPVSTDATTAKNNKPGTVGLRLFTLSGKRAPAYIDRIMPNSPAKKAGLKKDDLILAIGDEIIRNIKHYQEIEKTFLAGQELIFIVKRKRDVLDFTVTPDEKK